MKPVHCGLSCIASKKVSAMPRMPLLPAEGLKDLSLKDSEIAAKAIRDVMEYMEVTHLRGGITAHMKKEDNYLEWQALQARKAGKALLKVKQPDRAPIPAFNDLDLDFRFLQLKPFSPHLPCKTKCILFSFFDLWDIYLPACIS